MSRRCSGCIAASLFLLLFSASTDIRAADFSASQPLPITHTWPVTPTIPSTFGEALALSGSFAAIGAPFGEAEVGIALGAVFIYTSEEDSLNIHSTIFGEMADSAFGSTIAIAPPRLAITAQNAETVYIYRFDGATWLSEETLTQPKSLRFGRSLVFDSNALLIGAPNPGGIGAVYPYHFDGTWIADPPLLAAEIGGQFGHALALDGDVLAIGASQESLQGAVHIARREGGVFTITGPLIAPQDAPTTLQFGASLALSDDLLAVGAPASDDDLGAVFVYHQSDADSWDLAAILHPPEGLSPRFGAALSFAEGSLLVGAPAEGFGRVYVYNSPDDPRAPVALIESDMRQPEGGYFGHSIASWGRRALVGSPAPMASSDGDALGLDFLYAAGNTCTDGSTCTSGHCVDALCCESLCDAPCQRCSIAGGGSIDGMCTALICEGEQLCLEADDACSVTLSTSGETTAETTGETTDESESGGSESGGIGIGLEPWSHGCACTVRPDPQRSAAPLGLLVLALLSRRRRR